MKPVKSKRSKLNLEVHTSLGVDPQIESDLAAHSSSLSEEDLAETAAYGATRSCPNPLPVVGPGLPKGPFYPGSL